jgi:hypothetical protein
MHPDILILSCGAQIYECSVFEDDKAKMGFVENPEWHAKIKKNWDIITIRQSVS